MLLQMYIQKKKEWRKWGRNLREELIRFGKTALSARMNIGPTKHPYIMQKHPFIIPECVSLTGSRETLKTHTQTRLDKPGLD